MLRASGKGIGTEDGIVIGESGSESDVEFFSTTGGCEGPSTYFPFLRVMRFSFEGGGWEDVEGSINRTDFPVEEEGLELGFGIFWEGRGLE